MIEKLESVTEEINGASITRQPNNEEIVNKLNEIIDYINHSDKVSVERIAKELDNVLKIKGGMY